MNRPNILFLMPDQLRHDFLSCYGATFIDTPQIDSLARDGTLYRRAYSTSPVCVTARHNLLTGLNSIRAGVRNNGQFLRPDYSACGIRTWPEILSQAGYHSAGIGKMHFYPWDAMMGYDERVVCEDKRWLHIEDDYGKFLAEKGLRKLHGNEHEGYYENKGAIVHQHPFDSSWDYFVGDAAAHFLRKHDQDKPFAAMVGFPGPHCPYDPSPEYADRFDPAAMPAAIPEVEGEHPQIRRENINGNNRPWNGVDHSDFTDAHKAKIRAHYCGLIAQIDHLVGEILQALEDTGQLDNTVIFFASDHGDYLGDHNLIGKGHFFEASCHVPLIARVPGQPGGRERDELVALADINPSMIQTAGCAVPDYCDFQPLPGIGLAESAPREYLYGMMAGGWMAFDGRHKLCKYASGEHMLFDLDKDPTEIDNRISDDCENRERLDAALTREIMRSVLAARHDQLVYSTDLSGDRDFGQPGWQRTYPQPL
ncbi:sulfatase-like hydrolase/transferase [bacterium]|nr:sulfatase-like hydrolase/transferase [bacterium]